MISLVLRNDDARLGTCKICLSLSQYGICETSCAYGVRHYFSLICKSMTKSGETGISGSVMVKPDLRDCL